MEQVAIIYPLIAMFSLSFCVIMLLGLSRFFAIHTGKVSVKFYRTYNEGKQPEWLHLLGRHAQLHFEVPPLFYIASLFLYVTQNVTETAVYLAWAFVALRCVHTYIHLGPNNVSYRFFCFGASLMVLAALWMSLLVGVI